MPAPNIGYKNVLQEFSAVLEVDTPGPIGPITTTLAVSQISLGFSLNSIPRASCSLSVGRNVSVIEDFNPIEGGNYVPSGASKIYGLLLEELRRGLVPARIIVNWKVSEAIYKEAIDTKIENPFTLFSGLITSISAQNGDNSSFNVIVDHFLYRLTLGSSISPTSHPSNPASLTFESVFAVPGGAGGQGEAADQAAGFSSSLARTYLDQEAILADLWTGSDTGVGNSALPEGKGIRGFFRKLASRDNIEQRLLEDEELETGPNQKALEVFNQFEPLPSKTYQLGKALKLDAKTYSELQTVAFLMAEQIGKDGPLEMANRTFWDKLVEYAQIFQFSIVPLPDRVLLVPFMGSNPSIYETILAQSADFVGYSFDGSVPIRGVGVYGGFGLQADGLAENGNGGTTVTRIGGYYLDPKKPDGQLLLVQAPDWLRNIPSASPDPSTAPTPSGTVKTTGSPEAPTPPQPPGTPTERKKAKFKTANGLMGQYAKFVYLNEALKGRVIEVSSIFRVDIGPGSIVKVELIGDQFSNLENENLIGSVRAINISLNADSGDASMVFSISDLRTEQENTEISEIGVSRHPLYDSSWNGCPLIPPKATT